MPQMAEALPMQRWMPTGSVLPETESSRELYQKALSALLQPGADFAALKDGVYALKDARGRAFAVFKPQDEEAQAKLLSDVAFKGQGSQREYLAYMLDAQAPLKCRAGAPPTVLVTVDDARFFPTPKSGALSMWVENQGPAEDFGSSCFTAADVQRLALFDLRTLNLDRHGSNILVAAGTQGHKLIPIDHGCALPETFAEPWLDWRLWPQAAQPIAQLADNLSEWVLKLDPYQAKGLVQQLGLPAGVWKVSAFMTSILQAVAAQPDSAITLRDIAELLSQVSLPSYSINSEPQATGPIGQPMEPTAVPEKEESTERENDFEAQTVRELKQLAKQLGIKRPGVGWPQACPHDGNKAAVIAALRRWKFTAAGNDRDSSEGEAEPPRTAVKPPSSRCDSSLPIKGLVLNDGIGEKLLQLLQETAAALEAELLLTHEAVNESSKGQYDHQKGMQVAGIVSGQRRLLDTLPCDERVATVVR
eukprot:COSAG05_NODE_1084_length_5930_cov_11.147316_5_plen_476_part_00